MRTVEDILGAIAQSASEASRAFDRYVYSGPDDDDTDFRNTVEYCVEKAFLELRVFLEAKGLPDTLELVKAEHSNAKSDVMRSNLNSYGEPYSFWSSRIRQIVHALESTFCHSPVSTVTKEVVDIIRATAYSIADERCFPSVPNKEEDVHVRIEAVLRCVFPDLRHKPPIGKQIKNFQPDTGLPSVHTLIEYKYVSSHNDVKRVADEILTDTRAYVSKEWNHFLFVIYETRRLKPELHWNELIRQCEISNNTQVIVISGQEPKNKPKKIRANNRQ